MALRHGDLFYAIKKSIFPTIMSDVTVLGIIVNDNVFLFIILILRMKKQEIIY